MRGLLALAALLGLAGLVAIVMAVSASGAEGEGAQAIWQRCDGGAEDLSCSIPRGIGVNPVNGHLVVADQGNTVNRMVEFTAWGEFVKTWGWGVLNGANEFQICTVAANCKAGIQGSGSGQFSAPEGVAVDTNGNVYVFDFFTNRVQKFDSEGHFVLMFGGNVNKTKSEEGGSTEAQKNLCTAASGDVCQAGTTGAGKGQFNVPSPTSAVVLGPAALNRLYVGDKGRIQVFDLEGHYVEDVPDPESVLTGGKVVQSLAFGPNNGGVGTLFVARSGMAGVVRIKVTGQKVGSECSISKPSALAMAQTSTGAPTGNLYAFDEEGREVRQYGITPSACNDKEAPFAKGDVSVSTGIAAGVSCLESKTAEKQGADVYLSNSTFLGAFVRAYGPTPDKTATCAKPLFAPEIVAQYALSVNTSEAQLQAKINPRFYADTAFQVQYGTAACIEAEGWAGSCVKSQPPSPVSLGAPAVDFPQTSARVFIANLQPATEYRYRFLAQSAGGGPVFGAERSLITATLPPGGKDGCPNSAFRSGPSARLPDCRAYEMVSPVDKEGGDVLARPDRNARPAERNQSSLTGDKFTYSSFRPFAGATSAPLTSQYIAERGAGGWTNTNISAPVGVGFNPAPINVLTLVSGDFAKPQLFSPDLCEGWLTHNAGSAPPLAPGAAPFNANLYRRSNCGAEAGSYEALGKVAAISTVGSFQAVSGDGSVTIARDQAHMTQDTATRASASILDRLVCTSPTPHKPLSFQWLRNGAPIGGATGFEYTMQPANDAGKLVQCRMTSTNANGGSTQVANPVWAIAPYPATVPPLAPAEIPAPFTSGALAVGGTAGQTLHCDPGQWEGSPSFAFKWYRNGAAIAGAESDEYTVQPADLASAAYLQCEVAATNAAGTVVETSQVLATSPAPDAPISRPNMIGLHEMAYLTYGDGQLRSLCVLPGGIEASGCSAGTESGDPNPDGRKDLVTGALSDDASRAFWTSAERGKGRIYLRENPTEPQSALANGEATGAGKRTSGSNLVEETSTASGAFAIGQRVSGEGIPFGTTIAAVGANTLTLSANATKSTAKTALILASSECTEATKACTLGISAAVEANENSSRFWAADPQGEEVLFSTGSVSFEAPQDLYLYDVEAATPTLIAHNTRGVVGQSRDLSRIYFIGTEALTGAEENSEGAIAQAGQPNLYLRRGDGSLAFVATLSAADAKYETNRRVSPSNVEPFLHSARVSEDGESLAFMSTGSLTGHDNADAASGQPDAEVYRYDATEGELSCASCAPGGGRPLGEDLGVDVEPFWVAAQLPNVESELYASHVLSEDGKRVFFESFGPLVLADTNGAQDVYEWEELGAGSCTEASPSFSPQDEGCIYLISSGESPQDSDLLDASPNGRDVFIRTGSSLLSQDPGSFDVYDAREGGGFPPPPPPPPPCEGQACQNPPPPPAEVTPASGVAKAKGNLSPQKPRCAKKSKSRKAQGSKKPRCSKKKHKRAQRHDRRAHR